MVIAERSSNPGEANFKIEFRGHMISIGLDDSHLGRRLFRSYLAIYKGEEDVTEEFAGRFAVNDGSILNVEGETIFEIMRAIAVKVPAETVVAVPEMTAADFANDQASEAGERP